MALSKSLFESATHCQFRHCLCHNLHVLCAAAASLGGKGTQPPTIRRSRTTVPPLVCNALASTDESIA